MAALTIFDEVVRTDDRPSLHLEPRSRFLNRASGPVFDRMRARLESWFERYPETGRADLRGRLRSRENDNFDGAFWELYQHETLVRMGFDVEAHPDVPGTSRHPDFLATRLGQPGFYLEATVAVKSLEERAAEKRLGSRSRSGNDNPFGPTVIWRIPRSSQHGRLWD